MGLRTNQKLEAVSGRFPEDRYAISLRRVSVSPPLWRFTVYEENTVGPVVLAEGASSAEAVSRAYRAVFPKIFPVRR